MPKQNQLYRGIGDHLDPDTLIAFAENALNRSERASLFAHLAQCERCREELRVHAQLSDFHRTEMKAAKLTSGRFSTYLGALAGLASVAAGITLIYLHGSNQHKQPARLAEQRPVSRDFSSLPSQSFQSENRNGLVSMDSLTVRRRPLTRTASFSQQYSPGAPWRTARFRAPVLNPGLHSVSDQSALPRPFASARLDMQTNFRTASFHEPEPERGLNHKTFHSQVAVETIWGERRIYLSLLRTTPVVNR